jgi:hypothetical protein
MYLNTHEPFHPSTIRVHRQAYKSYHKTIPMGLIIYKPKDMREIDRIREEFRRGYKLSLGNPAGFQGFVSRIKPRINKYPAFFPGEIDQIAEQERLLAGHA